MFHVGYEVHLEILMCDAFYDSFFNINSTSEVTKLRSAFGPPTSLIWSAKYLAHIFQARFRLWTAVQQHWLKV